MIFSMLFIPLWPLIALLLVRIRDRLKIWWVVALLTVYTCFIIEYLHYIFVIR